MRNAKIKFMLVAMFTLLTVTLLSISCKVEDAAVKEWTVTIDPNNMTLGGTLKVTVKDGEKASLPADIVPPTDYEIPYYSTAKDDYSKVFDFANTAVTSDITVYPHYRFASDRVYKNLVGNWLDINEAIGLKNKRINKIAADNALNAKCFARNSGTDLDLSLEENATIVQGLIKLAVLKPQSAADTGDNSDTIGSTDIYCTYFGPLDLEYISTTSDSMKYKSSWLFDTYQNQGYTVDIDKSGIATFKTDDNKDIKQFKKVN